MGQLGRWSQPAVCTEARRGRDGRKRGRRGGREGGGGRDRQVFAGPVWCGEETARGRGECHKQRSKNRRNEMRKKSWTRVRWSQHVKVD